MPRGEVPLARLVGVSGRSQMSLKPAGDDAVEAVDAGDTPRGNFLDPNGNR
jgi:hypothetical protein